MQTLQFSEIKTVMHRLLLCPDFDSFLLCEAQISTFSTFHIDGHLNPGWLTDDEQKSTGTLPDFCTWSRLRPICYALIKGKRTPLSFRFIFSLAPHNIEKLLKQTGISLTPGDINGLYLNLRYDGAHLSAVTGTSLSLFTLDKTLEHAWDQMVEKFLLSRGLNFDRL